MLVTLLIAVPIALHFLRARDDRRSTGCSPWLAYVVSALPVFWLGYVAVYVFIPPVRRVPAHRADRRLHRNGPGPFRCCPFSCLGIGNGTVSGGRRHLREEMSRVMGEDYIRTARAKGASGVAARLQGRPSDPDDRDHCLQDSIHSGRRGDRRTGGSTGQAWGEWRGRRPRTATSR